MRKYYNNQNWDEVDEKFKLTNITSFKIRCTHKAILYEVREDSSEIAAALINSEEILVTYPSNPQTLTFRIDAPKANRAFIEFRKLPRLNQRVETEIFTTLDRPAPLSPEMLAIRRLSRANELERERQREYMERREEQLLETFARTTRENANQEKETVRKDGTGRANDAENDSGAHAAGTVPKSPQSDSEAAPSGSRSTRGDEISKDKGLADNSNGAGT